MPREIYNEGRVVGLSAYEVYVKEHLSEDPSTPAATEKEWLAASLASGASMILKVTGGNSHTVSDGDYWDDIPIPETSSLAAANTIIASYFDGEAKFELNYHPSFGRDDIWASEVTSYGNLIQNYTAGTYTNMVGRFHPENSDLPMTDTQRKKLTNYGRILDGVILQPGTYTDNPKHLDPKLSGRTSVCCPIIRLHLYGKIEEGEEPLVLLTGFTSQSILSGVSKVEGSDKPQDGDFLGPGSFPWANKIIFTTPTSYMHYLANTSYDRTIRDYSGSDLVDVSDCIVDDNPVIDMRSDAAVKGNSGRGDAPVLESYYNINDTTDQLLIPGTNNATEAGDKKRSMRIQDNIHDFSTTGEGSSILTVYQKKYDYPPILYGTYVSSLDGQHYLHPIDTAAPGTVKMFTNGATATNLKDYEDLFPGTFGMKRADDGQIYTLDSSGNLTPVVTVPGVTAGTGVSVTTSSGNYVISSPITAGDGIKATLSNGTYTISSPVKAGTGITVSHSSGEYTVNAKVANIKSGTGIKVTSSNGTYTINSTVNDLSAFTQAYSSRLNSFWGTSGTESYTEVSRNWYRSFNKQNDVPQETVVRVKYHISDDTVTLKSGIAASGGENHSGAEVPSTISLLISTEILPTETSTSWGDGDKVLQLGVTNGSGAAGAMTADRVTFSHSLGPIHASQTQYLRSVLFGLKFKNILNPIQYIGKVSGGSDEWIYYIPEELNAAGVGHGVWNVVNSTGYAGLSYDYNYAAWDVPYNGTYYNDTSTANKSRIDICAMNCGDGYNTRFENDPNVVNNRGNLYTTHMNLTIQFSMYVKKKFLA